MLYYTFLATPDNLGDPMNKTSSAKKLQIIDGFDHSPIMDWIVANRKNILYGIGALIVLFLAAFRILSIKMADAETDYLNAQTAFTNIEENQDRQENVARLQTILNSHPDLRPKYDADVAQTLLIAEDPSAAAPFAAPLFQRTADQGVDDYRDYGKTSLQIASGQYEAALTEAQSLKTKLASTPAKNPILFGFNLIRIATLEQTLGHKEKELKAWEEVQKFAGFSEISPLFADGRTNLQAYIDNRKAALKK